MKRKIREQLLKWKREEASETALLVEGARRVGKSFSVLEFAKAEYRSHVLVDFNKAPAVVKGFFENDLEDLDAFFRKISEYYGVRLHPGETLFVFDEVQQFPRARAAIKYLVEDGRYHFVETGSLMSIRENVEGIVIPSEEKHVRMHPMDFEEFLWATGREELFGTIAGHFADRTPMGAAHRKAMDAFREYLVVGGMPQAVEKWVRTGDLARTDAAKRRILALYRADIRKHAGKHAMKAEAVFDEIPGQLQKHDRTFRFSSLGKDARMRDWGDAFLWLQDAMVSNIAYNVTEPTVGLAMSADSSTMKCYMADTGLLVSHAFGANELAAGGIHRRILFDSLSFNAGMLMENAIAQMLTAMDLPLYFFSRDSRDDASERMEIDFLVANDEARRSKNVTPVEVKSAKDYSTASLDKFRAKFKANVSMSVILHPGDVAVSADVMRLPLYMAPFVG